MASPFRLCVSGSEAPHPGRLTPRQGGADDRAWWFVAGAVYLPLMVGSWAWFAWDGGVGAVIELQLGPRPVWDAVLGLVLGGLASAASRWGARRWRWMADMADALGAQLGPLAPLTTLVLAVCSGLGEEWLFRGVILQSWGQVASVVLFALAHTSPDPALRAWPVLALAMGAVFVALAVWTGGLMAPVVLHITVNALNLRWLVERHQRQSLPRG